MVKVTRLLFLLICGALLGLGIAREKHWVHSLETDQYQPISGAAFVAGATVDSYMLRDSRLYDIYSLSKTTADIKDCKT